MEQEELDSLMQLIENPVRRRIIKRLAQQPCYALQLSKELGLGQPLVAKHLGLMESAGLVTATIEDSPSGPRRKRYSLARSVSITMDLGPNLFLERGIRFEPSPRKETTSQVTESLRKRAQSAADGSDDRTSLSRLSDVLKEIDGRIEDMEEERADLLRIRNQAMHEAARIAAKIGGAEKRMVLFHILDHHDTHVESISESLNLREFVVRAILEELERDYFE